MAELRVAGSSITHTSSMTEPAPMLVCHEPLSSLKSPVNKLKRRSDLIDSLSALSPRSLSCTSRGPQHSYSLAKIRKQQVLLHGSPLRSCSADSAPRASFADTRYGLGSTSPDDVPAAPSDTMIQLGDRGTESNLAREAGHLGPRSGPTGGAENHQFRAPRLGFIALRI